MTVDSGRQPSRIDVEVVSNTEHPERKTCGENGSTNEEPRKLSTTLGEPSRRTTGEITQFHWPCNLSNGLSIGKKNGSLHPNPVQHPEIDLYLHQMTLIISRGPKNGLLIQDLGTRTPTTSPPSCARPYEPTISVDLATTRMVKEQVQRILCGP